MSLSDPSQLRTALDGVNYPASKEQLVDQAEHNGAPERVVSALRAMPPVDYANSSEVLSSVEVRDTQEQNSDHPIIREVGENRYS